MPISNINNSINVFFQQEPSNVNEKKIAENNTPLAGHEEKLALSGTSVAKLTDKREYDEYQNRSDDLKKITPKILDQNQHYLTENQLDLQIKKNSTKTSGAEYLLMERIDADIAPSNLIALDLKIGTEATNRIELQTLGTSQEKADKKYKVQLEKSTARGASINGFTLDGATNMTNSSEYKGVEVKTKTKDESNAVSAINDIKSNIDLIPDPNTKQEILDNLIDQLKKIKEILQKEATSDAPVSYSGASLYMAIDINDSNRTNVKLIDLGHPIRTDKSFAVNGVTVDELRDEIEKNHAGVTKGIDKLISTFDSQRLISSSDNRSSGAL